MEAGEIVNTHGIRGEVKVRHFCDSLSDLLSVKTVYINEKPLSVLSSRTHKGFALMLLEGVDTVYKAESLKNTVLFVNRKDLIIPEGKVLLQDILGFTVFDERTGRIIGQVSDILSLPKSEVLIIKGEEEYLIPSNAEFVKGIDKDNKQLRVRTIEGMLNEI